jgi:peptidoglycan/xylan/chitin deacetylase (PgdA/CDA1 family)
VKPWMSVRRRLARLRPEAGLVLAHHRVGEPPGDRERELVPTLSTRRFEERLEILQQRFRVVPASHVVEAARARRRREPVPIALTFDDDLRSHLDVVAPILLRGGLPATFFVGPPLPPGAAFWWEDLQALADAGSLPGRLASLPEIDLTAVAGRAPKAIHDAGRTIEGLPADRRDAVAAELHGLAGTNGRRRLDADAMAELVRLGFDLGFHTPRHYLLTALDDELLARELVDGRDVVEEIAGRPVATIAYPHGKADARVAEAARAAGFEVGFTGGKRPIDRRTDPLLVGRIETHDAPVEEFEGRLAWALDDRFR